MQSPQEILANLKKFNSGFTPAPLTSSTTATSKAKLIEYEKEHGPNVDSSLLPRSDSKSSQVVQQDHDLHEDVPRFAISIARLLHYFYGLHDKVFLREKVGDLQGRDIMCDYEYERRCFLFFLSFAVFVFLYFSLRMRYSFWTGYDSEAADFLLKMVRNALPGTNWDELPLPPNRMAVINVGLEYPPDPPPAEDEAEKQKVVKAKIYLRIQRPKLGHSDSKNFDVRGEVKMRAKRFAYCAESARKVIYDEMAAELKAAGFLTVNLRLDSKELMKAKVPICGDYKVGRKPECAFSEVEIFASTR
ncbi:unnamed protein product [Amoebophrya sp. A120]|nr:unnamed protein product [Amoebophrya sp. A120]|eukprot:GSA120T00010548001.1